MVKETQLLGQPVPMTGVLEITPDGPDSPGFGWDVSEECTSDIEEIDSNLRLALVRTVGLVLK